MIDVPRGQRGFTLIELLVTLAILSALFGIVTVALGGIGAGAEGAANAAELGRVQAAVDVYMADQSVPTVAARTEPATINSGDAAWSDAFLRSLPTKCEYSWSGDGAIAQGSCSDVSCSVPAASAVVLLRIFRRRRSQKEAADDREAGEEDDEDE